MPVSAWRSGGCVIATIVVAASPHGAFGQWAQSAPIDDPREEEEESDATQAEPSSADEADDSDGPLSPDEDSEPPLLLEPTRAVPAAIDARRTEFQDKAYAFCHDEDVSVREARDAQSFCPLLDDEAKAICPAIEACCKEHESWWSKLSFFSWFSETLSWVVISVLCAVALVGLGTWLVRLLEARRAAIARAGKLWTSDPTHKPLTLPDAEPLALLSSARTHLMAGRLVEALLLLQVSLLRFIDLRGFAKFHPSKTNGEYLRALRGKDALFSAYKSVAIETERIRFGGRAPDEQAVTRCVSLVEAALTAKEWTTAQDRQAATLAGALFVGIAVGASLLAGGCELELSSRPFHSHSAGGMASLPSILRTMGYDVRIGPAQLRDAPMQDAVIVLSSRTLAIGMDAETMSQTDEEHDEDEHDGHGAFVRRGPVDAWLDANNVVIILDEGYGAASYFAATTTYAVGRTGNPAGLALLLSPSDVDDFCGLDMPAIGEAMSPHKVRIPYRAGIEFSPEIRTSSLTTNRLVAFGLLGARALSDGKMYAHALGASRVDREGADLPGCVLLIPSDVVRNIGLLFPGNAGFAGGLFGGLVREGETIFLVDDLTKTRQRGGLFRAMLGSRLLPLIAQGLLALVAFFMLKGVAFGPLVDTVTTTHKSFIEHVEAIGSHYARCGESGRTHAARSLARFFVHLHRRVVRGGAPEDGWRTLAEQLAHAHSFDEKKVWEAIRLGLDASGSEHVPSPQAAAILSKILDQKRR